MWNGNEVWLLAAGGSMVVAFPHLYAASFSGFYLALMLVLWLLVLRGLGIEFRHQIDHDMWRQAWDVAFSLSSALLALLFGVALGNVLRGVPLDEHGEFQGTFSLMLNRFALLGGVLSVALLSMHGAAWVVVKTDGPAAGARAALRRRALVGGDGAARGDDCRQLRRAAGLHRQLRPVSVAAPRSRHHRSGRHRHQVLPGRGRMADAPLPPVRR